MSIELPLLRLAVAGFSAEQQACVGALLKRTEHGPVTWEPTGFADADAWWLCGARSKLVEPGLLRVGAGNPTARALHLNLAEVDRPMAFAEPLPGPEFARAVHFDLDDFAAANRVLDRFAAWLQPVVAQFGLASCLVEHYGALGPGSFSVVLDGALIAVVDMRGEIAVLPTASPGDFADAIWKRRAVPEPVPENFLKTTISQLMWDYAARTRRDLLPAHYRTDLLYFRRPPRLPQRLMKDAHLLLLRELAASAGTFQDLQQRTGLVGAHLSRPLAALYYVGAITSNRKRAAASALRHADSMDSGQGGGNSSVLPSSLLDSKPGAIGSARPSSDLTAPAPLIR